jgi:hypothetical protein
MNCSVWFGLVFVEYDWLLIKTSQGQPALPCVMERVCKSGEMRYEETKAIQITREQCELNTPFPPSTPFSSSLHPIDLIPNVKDTISSILITYTYTKPQKRISTRNVTSRATEGYEHVTGSLG